MADSGRGEPTILVATPAAAGAVLAPNVGLHVSVAGAVVSGLPADEALRSQVVASVTGAVFGTLLLVGLGAVPLVEL